MVAYSVHQEGWRERGVSEVKFKIQAVQCGPVLLLKVGNVVKGAFSYE